MKFLIVFALIAAASAAIVPLTLEEADVVRAAWDKIKHSEIDILYNVFKDHPDIQSRFPKFVGKDLETVKDTADFALHATRIVSFISEVLTLAGNPATTPAIKTLVNQLGVEHKNRGIPKEQFNEFRSSLTAYLSQHAPWGDNVAHNWNQAIDNVYFIIFSNLEGHPVL
jgi:hemoglobin-like flavoprotein